MTGIIEGVLTFVCIFWFFKEEGLKDMSNTDFYASIVILIMALDAILDSLFDILNDSMENYNCMPKLFHWHFCSGIHNLVLAVVAWHYWDQSIKDFNETLLVEKE